jgi:uncharacterized membrane protein YsdA (DUF1294 family)
MLIQFPFKKTQTGIIDWGRLLFAFILLLALIAFLGLYLYLSVTTKDSESWNRIKESFQVILPAVTGFLGTVVGFYFSKSRE